MKLSSKLAGGFILLLIILLFTSAYSYFQFGNTYHHMKAIVDNTVPVLVSSEELSNKALTAFNNNKDLLLAKTAAERAQALIKLNAASNELRSTIKSTFSFITKQQKESSPKKLLADLEKFQSFYNTLNSQLNKINALNIQMNKVNNQATTVIMNYSSIRTDRYFKNREAQSAIEQLSDIYKKFIITATQLFNNPTMDKKKLLNQARSEQMTLRSNGSKVSKLLILEKEKDLINKLKQHAKEYARTLRKFYKANNKKNHPLIAKTKEETEKIKKEMDTLFDTLIANKAKEIETDKTALKDIKFLELTLPRSQILTLRYQISQNKNNLQAAVSATNNSVATARKMLNSATLPADKNKIKQVIAAVESYQQFQKGWFSLSDTIYTKTATTLQQTIADILVKSQKLTTSAKASSTSQIFRLEKGTEQTMLLIVFTSLAGLILGVMISFLLTRSIVKPVLFVTAGIEAIKTRLDNITDLMVNRLVKGDWSSELNISSTNNNIKKLAEKYSRRKDEIGEAVRAQLEIGNTVRMTTEATNTVIDQVNNVLTKVFFTIDHLTNRSQSLETASRTLADGATTQAASLEEINSSLNEMNNQMEQDSNGANKAKELSQAATDSGLVGQERIAELVSKMSGINSETDEITQIIKTIDDIAFQTNLLALNAAVEAARAGQHGKGFAVVAEEVRNLATRSAKSAGETGTLIENIVKEIKESNTMVGNTALVLAEIADLSKEATMLTGTVAEASKAQSHRINQINQSLTQVDDVTQENAASAEETASASQQIHHNATELKELINTFILKESTTNISEQNELVSSENQTLDPAKQFNTEKK